MEIGLKADQLKPKIVGRLENFIDTQNSIEDSYYNTACMKY